MPWKMDILGSSIPIGTLVPGLHRIVPLIHETFRQPTSSDISKTVPKQLHTNLQGPAKEIFPSNCSVCGELESFSFGGRQSVLDSVGCNSAQGCLVHRVVTSIPTAVADGPIQLSINQFLFWSIGRSHSRSYIGLRYLQQLG